MANRNELEDSLQAILTGGLQGAQRGMESSREIEKALMLEKLKQGMKRQYLQESISKFGGTDGLRLKGLSGEGEPSYEFMNPTEERGKSLQNRISEAILKDIESGPNKNNLLYRSAETGEVVEPETALMDISKEGNTKYIISRQIPSKYGIKEQVITNPIKIAGEAQGAAGALPALKTELSNLTTILEKPGFDWGPVGSRWVTAAPRGLVSNPELRGIREIYDRIRASILFGEAGKALTGTEKQEVLARIAPGGKSPKEWVGDLNYAYSVTENKVRAAQGRPATPYGGIIQQPPSTKNYVRTGTNSKGQRVGQLSDGTIEVIK